MGATFSHFPFTEEQLMVQESARQLAAKDVAPFAVAWNRDHTFPAHLLPVFAANGFLGIKIPMEYGGGGADMTSYALAIEAISEVCASTAVTLAVCNLTGDILYSFANEEQKERLLKPYLAGEKGAGSFCLSEPQAGSDAANVQTTAVLETVTHKDGSTEDFYILNGTKQWITNGAYAGILLVFASTEPKLGGKGLTCFAVEGGMEGLVVGNTEKKMGLHASNTVQIILDNCRVPARNIIGGLGGGYRVALSALSGGRIGVAAQCVGIGEAALKEGVKYAQDRRAFKKALSEFQALQFMIADSRMELDQSWLLTLNAARLYDEDPKKAAKASSMAKLMASESCGRVCDRMLQIHGGYGYVEDYLIERLYRDARVTRIYEGTSEVQRLVIAREIFAE